MTNWNLLNEFVRCPAAHPPLRGRPGMESRAVEARADCLDQGPDQGLARGVTESRDRKLGR
jgi:hypothetical protein